MTSLKSPQEAGISKLEEARELQDLVLPDTNKLALPPGFTVEPTGVYFTGDQGKRVRVCSPLYVRARTRDEHGHNHGLWLEFPDADERTHRMVLLRKLLAGHGVEMRQMLLGAGVEIEPDRQAHRLLNQFLSKAKSPQSLLTTTKPGWLAEAGFAMPDRAYGISADGMIFEGDKEVGLALVTGGSLEGWQEEIARLCRGNSRLILAIGLAFAAPLIKPLHLESGGINLVGGTGIGKTTALNVSVSTMGDPDHCIHTWHATINGLETMALGRNDLLLTLDELGMVDPDRAGEAAYLLASGSEKRRMRSDGTGRVRNNWRLLILSSGEVTLADHMKTGRRKVLPGQETRLIDLMADAGRNLGTFEDLHGIEQPAEFSDRLKRSARTHYGHPLRAFLESLTRELAAGAAEGYRDRVRAFCREHCSPAEVGKIYRVAERFGLAALGGELATAWGITGWEEGEATDAAVRCFQDWLAAGRQERDHVLQLVREYFEAHSQDRFLDWAAAATLDEAQRQDYAGIRRDTSSGVEFFVFPEAFRNEICSDIDPRTVAGILVEEGHLRPDGLGKKNQVTVRLPVLGHKRVYHLGSFKTSRPQG